MCKNSTFIYSPQFKQYEFYKDHPFNPLRTEATLDLLKKTKAISDQQITPARLATVDELLLAHDYEFIHAVEELSKGHEIDCNPKKFGLNTNDIPVFNGMHEAASWIVGGTLQAADYVCKGKGQHALNLAGGFHHGHNNKASGFCVYNDISVAIEYIVKNYKMRVLYVDTDAHHGDGVQWHFYDRADVCTFSVHESGEFLFPGTGSASERGKGFGYSFAFNVPLDPFTTDEQFLSIYEKGLREITDYFRPDVIITQNGADAHLLDPLTHLQLTQVSYTKIPQIAHQIAHEYCEGRWIALGGGGYNLWQVVPKAWASVWYAMNAELNVPPTLPSAWVDHWEKFSGELISKLWEDTDFSLLETQSQASKIKNQASLQDCLKYIQNPFKRL